MVKDHTAGHTGRPQDLADNKKGGVATEPRCDGQGKAKCLDAKNRRDYAQGLAGPRLVSAHPEGGSIFEKRE